MSVILKSTQSMSRELEVHPANSESEVFLEIRNNTRAGTTGISVKKDLLLAALGATPQELIPTVVRTSEVLDILNNPDYADYGKLALLRKLVDPNQFEFPEEFGAVIEGAWKKSEGCQWAGKIDQFAWVSGAWHSKREGNRYSTYRLSQSMTNLKVVK